MISYKQFEKMCVDELKKELAAFDKKEVEEYLREEDTKAMIKQYYAVGVDRYKNGTKHDDKIAFGYCVDTAVENLRLLF